MKPFEFENNRPLTDEEKLVININTIIKEAISHGGDPGGAYFCNKDGLHKSIEKFMSDAGLDENYGIVWEYNDEFPVITPKEYIKEE